MAENKDINRQISEVDGEITSEQKNKPEYNPVYQLYPDSKIPVSKSMGSFWHARQKEMIAYNEKNHASERWDEVIRYYQNDQSAKSGTNSDLARPSTGSKRDRKHSTENIVFANVSALVPATFAKNPDVELTATEGKDEARAQMYEKLIESLLTGKVAPAVFLKNKMKRGIVTTMLTNVSYFEVSFLKKEQSSAQAMQDIEALSEKLQKAKSTSEIEEIEGQLLALESKVNLLGDAGPKVRLRMPWTVLIDPNNEDDLNEAQYIMFDDYLRTSYIQAMYGKKNDKGEWESIYEPTHILSDTKSDTDIGGRDSEINNFTLLEGEKDYQKYGYKTKEEYDNACRTRVWYVWDRTTRRVLMFNDKDWSWPIWVWDDPYKLTNFYPIFPMSFYTDPTDRFGKSEVMYYLDQQDEINKINDERSRMRHWVMTKIFVNTTAIPDATKVQEFLNNSTDEYVKGIALPDGVKLGDAIGTLAPPSAGFDELFQTEPIISSINRISSVTPIMQNVQFKTNTTNKAIESYESTTQTRLDEKIDAIEDVISDIGNALLELCVQFMPEEQVRQLVPDVLIEKAGGWKQYDDPARFRQEFDFKIVGGSTLKPTSKVKKEQAIQIGQVLGQFAQANPNLVVVMLKVIERAFNEDVNITEEEWAQINQSIATAQQADAGGGGGGNEEEILNQAMQQVEQLFDQLPPDAKQAVGQAIAEGTPLKQIVQELIGGTQQQQPQQAPAQAQ